MVSLVDIGLQDFVAPITDLDDSENTIGRIGYFTNSGPASTQIITLLNCTDYGLRFIRTDINRNWANGTVPITSYSCPFAGTFNFTVWLSDNYTLFALPEQTNILSIINHTMTTVDCLTGNSTKGCMTMMMPPKIQLPGSSEINITLPMEVNCGYEHTSDYVLHLHLTTSTRDCGPFFWTLPCAVRSFNHTFTIPGGNLNCTGPIGSTANLTMSLFTPSDHANAMAIPSTGFIYPAERWAGYRKLYQFRVAGPFVSVDITPGAPTTASVGGVSVVTPPALLPAGLSGSLNLEIGASPTSANVIAAVEVKLSNGSDFKVQNLSTPLQVTFPFVAPTPGKDSVCHYWDTTTSMWSTDGCDTLQSAAGEWICSCNHATDFSILLLDSGGAEVTPTEGPFYAYSVLYIILGLLALYPAIKVIALRHGHFGIILEHLGVFAVCTLRAFLSIYQLGVSGPVTSIALSTISAVPRFLEFTIFSFIIATWGALLHFSMGNSNPFAKVRPYFIGINVVALIIVLYAFIAFGVSPSYDAAIVGEALLATNSVFLSVGFLVYATWLHRQFAKMGGGSESLSGMAKYCAPRSRVVYIGWTLSFSFVAQAIFACLALSAVPHNGSISIDPSETRYYIDLYNGLYRLFNLLTLGSILALYFDGIRKIVAKESTSGNSSNHNRRSQPNTQNSHVPMDSSS